ncbi:MAG: nucleoside triphosphate pyrophosphohydrolase [Chloroflexota bacterium]|nr:nucleoside triphosphate pyrophosphohydrolase [Chloroflexota bacterium]
MKEIDGSGEMKNFDDLVAIIARLRAPGGCPWDREQTHDSIKGNLLEEAYEVVETIDEGDMTRLCEELGDLLMQIVLHSQMAVDDGDFDIGDVLRGISEKLVRRHPHVFGEVDVKDSAEVIANWEDIKRKEGKTEILAGLPKNMPSLAYAQALGRRVARVGFDWETVDDIIDKLAEEVAELQQAIGHRHRVEEFGDILFTLVCIARRMDIDAEVALKSCNERFYRRFSYMERACKERGVPLSDLTLEQQDALWDEAKRELGE